MKRLIILALIALMSASFCSVQAQKKVRKRTDLPIKTQPAPVTLTTGSDSVSYAAGVHLTEGLVNFLGQQGIDKAMMPEFIRGLQTMADNVSDPALKAYSMGLQIGDQLLKQMLPNISGSFEGTPDSIQLKIFMRGFIDALQGTDSLFAKGTADKFFGDREKAAKESRMERLYGENRRAGQAFLEENGKKEGVITTKSGLQYKVIEAGNGPVPTATDKVKVHYEGRLIDGTVFDASRRHGDQPSTFQANRLIAGWTEALTLMPVGSKWQLYIPYQLAYGERDSGKIKPFSTLIFDLELIGIEK